MVENEKQEQKFIFQFLVVRLGVAAWAREQVFFWYFNSLWWDWEDFEMYDRENPEIISIPYFLITPNLTTRNWNLPALIFPEEISLLPISPQGIEICKHSWFIWQCRNSQSHHKELKLFRDSRGRTFQNPPNLTTRNWNIKKIPAHALMLQLPISPQGIEIWISALVFRFRPSSQSHHKELKFILKLCCNSVFFAPNLTTRNWNNQPGCLIDALPILPISPQGIEITVAVELFTQVENSQSHHKELKLGNKLILLRGFYPPNLTTRNWNIKGIFIGENMQFLPISPQGIEIFVIANKR